MFKHSLSTLESGLPVIKVPMKQTASITCLVLCNTGSRYEAKSRQGIAHFFEHMVFKGTDKFPTAHDLAKTVDSIGAEFNAYTGKEYTGYYVKAASQHLELALDVLSDMLLTPRLRQEDIDREKGVIVEELNMYLDTPASHIGALFDQLVYSQAGLAHNIVGTKQTIRSFTTQHFLDLLRDWYGQGNLLLIMAGDAERLTDPKLELLVAKMFSKGKRGQRQQTNKHDLKKWLVSKQISARKLHVEYKKTEQAHFVLGWPGINHHDQRRYVLAILGNILGGNMSSRLFTEVREKRGLCYYVHSDIDTYHDTGMFGASAGVDPSRVEEAIKVTSQEFSKVATGQQPITADELARAKEYISGKTVLGLEDSDSVAQYFGMKQLIYNEIEDPDRVLAKVKKVTLAQVNQMAKELVRKGQMRLALIGPYKSEEKFAKLLI